tara:strand:- start:587 stop:808 length:222 start_codon:yes stop_codon:yes gene_type:complete
MTVNINGKNYDDTKLDDKIKTAVVQAQTQQNRMKQLQIEFENCKVLLEHHTNYLKENLPAEAEIKEEPKTTLE